MSKGSKIRRMAATFALSVSVLAPAGMVVGHAAPASAASADTVIAIDPDPPRILIGLLLPAVQAAHEAARR